jgi:hypothetical protein
VSKFSITYSRLVQTVPFENVSVSLTREFDDEEVPYDYAFKEVRDTVARWVDAERQILRR